MHIWLNVPFSSISWPILIPSVPTLRLRGAFHFSHKSILLFAFRLNVLLSPGGRLDNTWPTLAHYSFKDFLVSYSPFFFVCPYKTPTLTLLCGWHSPILFLILHPGMSLRKAFRSQSGAILHVDVLTHIKWHSASTFLHLLVRNSKVHFISRGRRKGGRKVMISKIQTHCCLAHDLGMPILVDLLKNCFTYWHHDISVYLWLYDRVHLPVYSLCQYFLHFGYQGGGRRPGHRTHRVFIDHGRRQHSAFVHGAPPLAIPRHRPCLRSLWQFYSRHSFL